MPPPSNNATGRKAMVATHRNSRQSDSDRRYNCGLAIRHLGHGTDAGRIVVPPVQPICAVHQVAGSSRQSGASIASKLLDETHGRRAPRKTVFHWMIKTRDAAFRCKRTAIVSIGNRFQQRIPCVQIKLDVDLRGHLIGQIDQLLAAIHRQQNGARTLFHSKFHQRDRIMQGLD